MTDQTDANNTSNNVLKTPSPGHFFGSYSQCRDALLTQANRFKSSHGLHTDERTLKDLRGPEDESLTTDWLCFGAPKPKQAVVISSGTHGVEGFAGSAIQHQFVTEQLSKIKLDNETAIILIHANNPYGFAWLRRVTENNVDMNRNFCELFDPQQASADYELLFDALNPTDQDPENEALRWASLQKFVAEFGMRRCQQAAVEGQYKYPQGMQFGGHQTEPCVQNLTDMTQENLSQATDVFWLDIHTGLGEMGDCELISSLPADSEVMTNARNVWGESVQSVQQGDSVSTPLTGVMDTGITRYLPDGCQVAMVAPEFGTYPVDRVLRAIRADNWLHQHGPKDVLNDPHARQIKAELLENFRPDRAEWREKVLQTGRTLIDQAIQAIPGATIN